MLQKKITAFWALCLAYPSWAQHGGAPLEARSLPSDNCTVLLEKLLKTSELFQELSAHERDELSQLLTTLDKQGAEAPSKTLSPGLKAKLAELDPQTLSALGRNAPSRINSDSIGLTRDLVENTRAKLIELKTKDGRTLIGSVAGFDPRTGRFQFILFTDSNKITVDPVDLEQTVIKGKSRVSFQLHQSSWQDLDAATETLSADAKTALEKAIEAKQDQMAALLDKKEKGVDIKMPFKIAMADKETASTWRKLKKMGVDYTSNGGLQEGSIAGYDIQRNKIFLSPKDSRLDIDVQWVHELAHAEIANMVNVEDVSNYYFDHWRDDLREAVMKIPQFRVEHPGIERATEAEVDEAVRNFIFYSETDSKPYLILDEYYALMKEMKFYKLNREKYPEIKRRDLERWASLSEDALKVELAKHLQDEGYNKNLIDFVLSHPVDLKKFPGKRNDNLPIFQNDMMPKDEALKKSA